MKCPTCGAELSSYAKVLALIKETGGGTAADLIDAYREKYGERISQSGLYMALKIGEQSGVFVKSHGEWRMTPQATPSP